MILIVWKAGGYIAVAVAVAMAVAVTVALAVAVGFIGFGANINNCGEM